MSLTISLPGHIETKLMERARAEGKEVADFNRTTHHAGVGGTAFVGRGCRALGTGGGCGWGDG